MQQPVYNLVSRFAVKLVVNLFFLACLFFLVWPYVSAAAWTPLAWQNDGKHRNWPRDADGDFVEDAIDQSSDEKVTVIVELNGCYHPRESKLYGFLDSLGVVRYVGKYLTFVIVSDLPANRAADIAARPEVAMVELAAQPVMLDQGRRAMQVEQSTAYTESLEADLDWPGTVNGGGVNIAILDSGVDDSDPELAGRYLAGADCTTRWDECSLTNPVDEIGHGTFMAKLALGNGDAGIAPGARLVDIRAGGATGGLPGGLQRALELVYERKGRDDWNIGVVNVSMGQTIAGAALGDDGTDVTAQLVNLLQGHGVVVVAGAGFNGDERISEDELLCDSYDCATITAPGSASRAITVAGADPNGTDNRDNDTTPYAASGPRDSDEDDDQLDELKPDLTAPTAYGGSNAVARTSGVAALIKQVVPEMPPGSLADLLVRTAEVKVAAADADTTERYPHDEPSWHSKWGFGQLNAYQALVHRQEPSLLTDLTFQDLYATDQPTPWYDSLAISTERLDAGLSLESGESDVIRVGIRNAGQVEARRVRIRYGFYPFTAGIPAFQDIGTQVIDLGAGESTVLEYPWTPPDMPFGEEHGCLRVEIDYGLDSEYGDRSNVAQKNVRVGSTGSPALFSFRVQNPLPYPATIRLEPVEKHEGWTLALSQDTFRMEPGDCAGIVEARVDAGTGVSPGSEVTYHIRAVAIPLDSSKQKQPVEVGGVALRVQHGSTTFEWTAVLGLLLGLILIVMSIMRIRRRKG